MRQHLIGTQFQQLTVDLTPAEVSALSQQLAELTTKQAELEEDKKAVVSSFKERLDRVQCDARSCARKVTTRKDVREVECHILADYDTGKAATYRVDTWEKITERLLTASERQQSLEFEEPPDDVVEALEFGVEDAGDPEPAVERGPCLNSTCNGGGQVCLVLECPDFTAEALPQYDASESDIVKTNPTLLGMDFKDIQSWGWSRDEAKLLAAGFRLVRLDRDMKRIDFSPPNVRLYWQADTVRDTYAAAERDLKQTVEGPENFIAVGMNGVAGRCSKLAAAGFTFYRVEGLNGHHVQCRIKIGPSWMTWKKFDTAEACRAAWDELLNNDPYALEG